MASRLNIAWPLATLVGLHQNIHVIKTFAESLYPHFIVVRGLSDTEKNRDSISTALLYSKASGQWIIGTS